MTKYLTRLKAATSLDAFFLYRIPWQTCKSNAKIAISSLFSGYDKGELEILGKSTFSRGFKTKKKVEKPREKVE